MQNYGLKISNPGKNINSVEPRDYVFNSAYSTVKTVIEPPNNVYRIVEVVADSDATVTIPHLLGFVPLCMIYVELTPGSGRWFGGEGWKQEESCYVNSANFGTYADKDNLYITISNSTAGNLTVKYYYFIFGDSGE
jgi:hypothetical protein